MLAVGGGWFLHTHTHTHSLSSSRSDAQRRDVSISSLDSLFDFLSDGFGSE